MKVINFIGGPGAGKSTVAAELFAKMKRTGYNVELVDEYAKQLVWDSRQHVLADQLYVLAKQNRKLERLVGKVDYVITDSPLLLCACYAADDYYPSFANLCLETWDRYDNLTFFIDRDPQGYREEGRTQTITQAIELDESIGTKVRMLGVGYRHMHVATAADDIFFKHIEPNTYRPSKDIAA